MSGSHYRCIIHDEERDKLGYPTKIDLMEMGSGRRRAYKPYDIAFLNEPPGSGKVMCSCCGRQLKREYLNNPNWRYCPKCGSEIYRSI